MKVRWGRIFLLLVLGVVLCGAVSVGLLLMYGAQGGQTLDIPGGGAVTDILSPRRTEVPASPRAGGAAPTERPADRPPAGGLPPFKVLTLQYTPYMATLAHMDAGGYMEDAGYDLQLYDVYSDEINLGEE